MAAPTDAQLSKAQAVLTEQLAREDAAPPRIGDPELRTCLRAVEAMQTRRKMQAYQRELFAARNAGRCTCRESFGHTIKSASCPTHGWEGDPVAEQGRSLVEQDAIDAEHQPPASCYGDLPGCRWHDESKHSPLECGADYQPPVLTTRPPDN